MRDNYLTSMKNIFKKFIAFTIILTTLFNSSNVVFCDDGQSTTIEYIVKAKVTFIDDLTHNEFIEEHEIGDLLVEPGHSSDLRYEFLGWFDGDTKWNFGVDTVEEHFTLHAKYKAKVTPGPTPRFEIPNTGVNAIDEIVEAIETNNGFNSFVCIMLFLLIIIILFIILYNNKDDNKATKSTNHRLLKKIFIILLTVSFILPTNIVKADDDSTIATEDGDYVVKLVANIAATTYEIVVPASVDLNQEESFDVLGKADFFLYNDEPIQDLIISVDNAITFKNTIDETYTFDATVVSTLKESYTNTDINSMSATEYSTLGNISFELPTSSDVAGTFKGILTFTYSLRDKENE